MQKNPENSAAKNIPFLVLCKFFNVSQLKKIPQSGINQMTNLGVINPIVLRQVDTDAWVLLHEFIFPQPSCRSTCTDRIARYDWLVGRFRFVYIQTPGILNNLFLFPTKLTRSIPALRLMLKLSQLWLFHPDRITSRLNGFCLFWLTFTHPRN